MGFDYIYMKSHVCSTPAKERQKKGQTHKTKRTKAIHVHTNIQSLRHHVHVHVIGLEATLLPKQ